MLRYLLALVAILALPAGAAAQDNPRHFLFLGGEPPADYAHLLARPDIEGAQIVYNWRALEPREGV